MGQYIPWPLVFHPDPAIVQRRELQRAPHQLHTGQQDTTIAGGRRGEREGGRGKEGGREGGCSLHVHGHSKSYMNFGPLTGTLAKKTH